MPTAAGQAKYAAQIYIYFNELCKLFLACAWLVELLQHPVWLSLACPARE